MRESATMWMARCEGGSLFDDFIENSYIAIGEQGGSPDMSKVTGRTDIEKFIRSFWPDRPARRVSYGTGVFERYVLKMNIGDAVVTYDPSQRQYAVGTVTSGYRYEPAEDKQHFRDIHWQGKVRRDDLSTTARRSLGSMVSVYLIPEPVAAEIAALQKGESPVVPALKALEIEVAEESEELDAESVAARGLELIKDMVVQLSWRDMEEVVAGLLRSMGYKTRMTDRGSDRGRDVLASPDGLGLEQPRIVVEVKHRPNTAIDAATVRSFIPVLQTADRGLYVSTGGFTKDAKYEAERSPIPIMLISIDEFVKLLLEYYDSSDTRLRTLVPLRSIYWPLE